MAKEVTVSLSGPLFQAGAVGVFVDNLTNGLVDLTEDFNDEYTKRLKPGKGYRAGELARSQGAAKAIKDLEAGASGPTGTELKQYHRVEYGSRFMKAQNQRKNARRAIISSLKNPLSARAQKVIGKAVAALD